jgi:hypothetical protein
MWRGGFSVALCIVIGCSASSETVHQQSTSSGTSTGGGSAQGGSGGSPLGPGPSVTGSGGSMMQCETPPTPAGSNAVLAAAYEPFYDVFDLGPVPGVPDPLGGCVIKHDDPDTLLIAGASENPSGAIYAIGVTRGPCGHIIGFNGTAQLVATTPYVDANLIYTSADLLFYTQWPVQKLSQLLPGSTVPDRDTDLLAYGIEPSDSGPGGVGFVPTGNSAGEMRIITWPGGRWYEVGLTPDNNLYQVASLTLKTQLPNNPGGFAYVPAGSPGFPSARVIVAEWVAGDPILDRVATYAIDAEGDPIPNSRDEFLTKITRPWGAYFEEVTGDYLFLQWDPSDSQPDHVYLVQGFVPPPDTPPPPPAE